MGVFDTIVRSRRDLARPSGKCYGGMDFECNLVPKEKILEKEEHAVYEKKALAHELSGIEPVEKVILLSGKKEERLASACLKELLNDMGFNVDAIISGSHASDFTAVMNINGFVIPVWRHLANSIARFFPKREKMLLSKLAPGKDRLHIRAYGDESGKWMIIAHTDPNWMRLNLLKVFRGHVGYGAGDYVRGTDIMYKLLVKFLDKTRKDEVFTQRDIDAIAGNISKKNTFKEIKSIMGKYAGAS